MEEKTPDAGQLKVAKMRHKVLPSAIEKQKDQQLHFSAAIKSQDSQKKLW